MMRILFLLLMLPVIAMGQNPKGVPIGAVKPPDTTVINSNFRADGAVKLRYYATADTNKVLGMDASGNLVPRVKGGGAGIDTTQYIRTEGGQYVYHYPANLNGYNLTGLPNPVNPTDAVPYQFLQERLNGLSWKVAVLAATATELPAFTFDGTDQLVFNAVGACPVVDGVTLHLGSRVLNKNSTGAYTPFNGIFTVAQLGDGSTQCALQRSGDANEALELTNATVGVDSGATNRGRAFTQVNAIIALNVTPVTFVKTLDFVLNAGYGILIVGNTISINPSIVVTKDSVFNNPPWIGSLAWSKITGAPAFTTTYAALTDVNYPTTLANGQISKYNSSTGKWENFTPPYISANQNISVTGDATGGGTTSIPLTLATVNGNVGTFGSGTAIPQVTVNAKGLVTGVSTVTPTAPTISVTGDATGSGATSIPLTLATVNGNVGTFGGASAIPVVTVNAKGQVTGVSTVTPTGGATGSVTTVSVVTANGLGGTVSNPTTTPAITLTTSVNALVKGNGTGFIPAVAGTDYATPGTFIGVTSFSVAGTYTVTVPAGAKGAIVKGVGAGGGAGACAGTATTVLTISAGGSAGAQFEHIYTSIGWTSGTLTLAAGGSAGVITACPSCVASNGGNGGTSTWNDGTTTITVPGGPGSPANATGSQNRLVSGGGKPSPSTGANKLNLDGAAGPVGMQFGILVTGQLGGNGADAGDWGKGGVYVQGINLAGNNGSGNGSGGGGCISNAASGAANSKNGGAGTDARVDFYWFK